MATIDTIADRSTGSAIAGKAYFETSTNKFIVYNGSAWIEIDSDGTGAVPFQNRWGASFDGTNDYLLMGTSAISLDTDFTISAWFKPTSNALANYNFMCGWGNAASGQARVMQILHSKLSFEIFYSRVSGSTTLSADTWYHGAITFSGNDVEIFLNGSSDGTGTLSRATMASSLTFAGGTSTMKTVGFLPFSGLIDEFAVFDSVLTPTEISTLRGGASAGTLGVPASISALNPVGYWSMGDDSNDSPSTDPASNKIVTITDSSGNGNDATQSTASSQPTFEALDASTTSLSFDGSDDKLTVSDSSLGISGDLTMSFWFKADAFGTWNYPLILTTFAEAEASRYRGRCLGFNGAKLSSLTYFDHDYGSTTLNTGQWYHAAVVYERTAGTDAGFHTLYLNGSVDLTRTAVNLKDINYVETQIGKSYNANHFDGLLDDVAIFNSALSAPEVSSLAASRGAHIVNDLSLSPVVYYRMGEDDSLTDGQTGISQITDASGNGNHATQSVAASQPTASVDPIIYV